MSVEFTHTRAELRQKCDVPNDASYGHDNTDEASICDRLLAHYPSDEDDEACLEMTNDSTSHGPAFVDDRKLREIDQTGADTTL